MDAPHPADAPLAPSGELSAPARRPRRYGRFRAATLATVYLLMGIHIAHWKIAGSTLAPLELNEVMYTLELGIVTAGFIFMAAAFVSAAIFGRFFCSWGCHILALEDLCAWLLRRVRIRPKPVRSRVLMLVPPAAMFYMFIWPQVSRLLQGRSLPEVRVLSDADGWASFVTTDFWRNLPGPGITLLTFAFCGFAIVYILGSRSFCRYGCPYGVLFGLADRVAPGRIMVKGDCAQAGQCTAVCPSQVRVHEEIARFGNVVDASCLKCLTCVGACPNQALGFGFTRPSLGRSFGRLGRRRMPYDFTLAEDVLMAIVFVAALTIFRGLYGLVPFLLSLALAGACAYFAVLAVRLVSSTNVRLNNFQLKQRGRLSRWGAGFAVLMVALTGFTAHSAVIRYHEVAGKRVLERGGPEQAAIGHFRVVEQWGLLRPPGLDRSLAALYLRALPPARAEPYLRRILAREPADDGSRLRLARVLAATGRSGEARGHLDTVLRGGDAAPPRAHVRAAAHEILGGISTTLGDLDGAVVEYGKALDAQPGRVTAHLALAELLANAGRLTEAATHHRAALARQPGDSAVHYNLAVVLGALGQHEQAITHYRESVRLDPTDPEAHNNLGFLLARQGHLDQAVSCFQQAIRLAPNYAQPHFNLGRLLLELGVTDEATAHLQHAAQLDPQFAASP